ncbi:MAG: NAD(P)/FAD-dependent oxidoreductase [Deltaproteobacteria bacterium]|nr:NAD(P)/FAD-dependent oxidoreductase [Deltaproteobacteria bacterium]
MTTDYDDLVIGAGMAGLSAAALLARSGRRVLVLEAHDVPGGYAHTFTVRQHRFCAQVHYVFACGEGETIHRLLDALGVVDRVPFVRLDPEGFDHVVVGDVRVRIPNGLGKFRERLVRRFPEHERPITRYFHEVAAVAEELDRLPDRLTPWAALRSAHRHLRLLRYLRWTLADFYDHVGMPPLLRAILAGQSGDYLLPPRDVSFLLHVALVAGYDKGAYYPKQHFFHLVETIADVVRTSPGCALLLEHEVERIEVERGKVARVTTKNGRTFTAKRYVSNVDPRRTVELTGAEGRAAFARDRARLDYEYSCGTFTLYLAVRGLDLREHGFGSFNVWHYPHADIDRMYDDQLLRHDVSNPWLFMSTPTLHTSEPGLCPPGEQVLEIATSIDHAHYASLRRRDRREYNRAKKRIVDTVLDLVEARYVPGLRDHLTMRIAGTPATNERFCHAPAGNSYGAALVPKYVRPGRGPFQTGLGNLWMANATAGFPSVAGAIGAGAKLYEALAATV